MNLSAKSNVICRLTPMRSGGGGGPDFLKRRFYSISLLDHRKLNFQGAAHNNFFSRKNYRYHAQIHKKNLREEERGISN